MKTNTLKIENWEEDFDKKFKVSYTKEVLNKEFKTPEERLLWSIFGRDEKKPQSAVKDFITQEIAKAKEDRDMFYKKTLHSSLLCNDTGCNICAIQQGKKITTGGTPQTEVVEDSQHPYGGLEVYDVIETGDDKFSIAYVIPKTDTLKKEESMEDRFENRFIEDGLLNISKYCHERVLDFITQEIAKAKEEYLKEVDGLIKNVDEEFDLWTSGYLVACEDFEKILKK
jgi:hypothetical protein